MNKIDSIFVDDINVEQTNRNHIFRRI